MGGAISGKRISIGPDLVGLSYQKRAGDFNS
jgi:hypothetical protein